MTTGTSSARSIAAPGPAERVPSSIGPPRGSLRENPGGGPPPRRGTAGPATSFRSASDLLGHHRLGELLELAGVGVELPDALAQLLDGHGVFVVHPAVGLLIEVDLRGVGRPGRLGGEPA